jgi:hypothetical protein
MKYESPTTCTYESKDILNLKFLKLCQFQDEKVKIMVSIEGLDIRNTQVKYKSPITYHSKDDLC